MIKLITSFQYKMRNIKCLILFNIFNIKLKKNGNN